MSNVPPRDAGLASGIVNVSMQVAGALGVAILGTIATQRTQTLARLGHPLASALTDGYRQSFVVSAAAAGAAVLIALVVLRAGPRRRTSAIAERTPAPEAEAA